MLLIAFLELIVDDESNSWWLCLIHFFKYFCLSSILLQLFYTWGQCYQRGEHFVKAVCKTISSSPGLLKHMATRWPNVVFVRDSRYTIVMAGKAPYCIFSDSALHFFGQIGEASRWRVFYQHALPCLVSNKFRARFSSFPLFPFLLFFNRRLNVA